MYLKLIKVDCHVPNIVANFTFSFNVSSVSSSRITTSDKLQNSRDLRIISEQGFVPKSYSGSRLPLFPACSFAAALLKIPRSPDLDA